MLNDDNESGVHRAGDNHFENIRACALHMISQESRHLSSCALRVHAKKEGEKKNKQTIYQKDETFEKCEQIKVYGK